MEYSGRHSDWPHYRVQETAFMWRPTVLLLSQTAQSSLAPRYENTYTQTEQIQPSQSGVTGDVAACRVCLAGRLSVYGADSHVIVIVFKTPALFEKLLKCKVRCPSSNQYADDAEMQSKLSLIKCDTKGFGLLVSRPYLCLWETVTGVFCCFLTNDEIVD